MYPAAFGKKSFQSVKSYHTNPLPTFNTTHAIFNCLNGNGPTPQHPTSYIIKKYPQANFYKAFVNGHSPKVGAVYPFKQENGPLICYIYAYTSYSPVGANGTAAAADDEFLLEKPERVDNLENRAFYFQKALNHIAKMDLKKREEMFRGISSLWLWGSKYPPFPYYPEELYGTIFLNFVRDTFPDKTAYIIIHPTGNQFGPRVLGREKITSSSTSALQPFPMLMLPPIDSDDEKEEAAPPSSVPTSAGPAPPPPPPPPPAPTVDLDAAPLPPGFLLPPADPNTRPATPVDVAPNLTTMASMTSAPRVILPVIDLAYGELVTVSSSQPLTPVAGPSHGGKRPNEDKPSRPSKKSRGKPPMTETTTVLDGGATITRTQNLARGYSQNSTQLMASQPPPSQESMSQSLIPTQVYSSEEFEHGQRY